MWWLSRPSSGPWAPPYPGRLREEDVAAFASHAREEMVRVDESTTHLNHSPVVCPTMHGQLLAGRTGAWCRRKHLAGTVLSEEVETRRGA